LDKDLQLGFVMFSKKTEHYLRRDRRFAEFVGKALHRHLSRDPRTLKHALSTFMSQGVKHKTAHTFAGVEVWVITELDTNQNPRTTVVLPDEGGT
jgi:hypothetical protein